jgi:hypothetical protein
LGDCGWWFVQRLLNPTLEKWQNQPCSCGNIEICLRSINMFLPAKGN